MTQTIHAKTLCVKCKYHNGESAGKPWYAHRCRHRAVKRQLKQDPVTGRMGYAGRNDLGTVYLSTEESPYCRDVNHGNCEHFNA